MNIRLNFSTCPNDTFMFDALVNGKIDCEGINFDVHMDDIEDLNSIAINSDPDITKLSYATYPLIRDRYQIMSSGSALGYNSGPLLVSKKKIYKDELGDVKIGIPGEHTTANLLLDIAFPDAKNKRGYLFSDISHAIMDNEIDAGILIHEERFTYEKKGLLLVADLGAEWDCKFHLPIPLGAIVVRRDIEKDLQLKLNSLLKKSIEYAFANPLSSREYVKKHARELSDDTIEQHINMFVNKYSLDIADDGRNAVNRLIGTTNSDFI